MTNEQKRKQIVTLFGAYSKRLEGLYDNFLMQLSHLAIKSHVSVKNMLAESPLYHFDDYPELKQEFNNIFADYLQKEMLTYRSGISSGVALAYSHDAGVLNGFSVLSDKAISHARKIAAETFLRTRLSSSIGLNLSQLVWNYASQTKAEFEVAVSNVIADGLKKGTSAADLARQVKQYLNNPDMMYRRYHRTVVDAQGHKKDIVRWRRRIIDEQGKVRFIEEPLEKVGMGHYRSSRKNAERLMRTEINSAYHHANYERWQMEPFVIGIRIDLSPQHPVYDECDELQGEYPKDFLFAGWHPQCLCMSNPITIQGEEKKEFYRRLAAGEDMSNYVSPYAVKDIPENAKKWIAANRDKFIRAGERGKLGYVWKENLKYVRPQFSQEEQQKMGIALRTKKHIRTEEEKNALRKRWFEHQRTRAEIELRNAGVSRGSVISTRMDALDKAISTGDYGKMKDALDNLRRGIAIQREADFRHLQRDPVAIQEAWDARKAKNALIMKTGKNVWGVANNLGYAEILGMKGMLRDAIITEDVMRVNSYSRALAKEIASINKSASLFGTYIPNIKTHLQSLSVSDLKPVYEGILKKIQYIEGKYPNDLLKQCEKYLWEAKDYLGGNLYGVQQKYASTWKISQEAYFALADKTKLAYDWKQIETALATLKSFQTKSSVFQGYISDLDSLISSKTELSKAQGILAKAEKKKISLTNKRVPKLGEMQLTPLTDEDALKLIEKFRNEYGEVMDNLLRAETEQLWTNLTEMEKRVLTKYTQSYSYLNEPLRGIRYSGNRLWAEFEKDMPILTDALDKMKASTDFVVRRGTNNFEVKSLGKYLSDLKPGDEFVDGGFLSTAVHRSYGFMESWNMYIVVPRGASGIYAEPFSHFTDSFKFDYRSALWNGLTRESMGTEREWIGQRGAKFRVIKIEGNSLYLQIISQKNELYMDYRQFFY